MKTEILVPLYFWPYEELCISNYNQTINFIGVGGSSLAWGITFCVIWGFCSIWGEFWDRLEVFLGWYPGGLWCWSDPSTGRKHRQCVERKICNPSLQWGRTNTVLFGVSVCGGRWNGRGLFLLGSGGLEAWERAACGVSC